MAKALVNSPTRTECSPKSLHNDNKPGGNPKSALSPKPLRMRMLSRNPSQMAAISRGPPRPNDNRDKARAISGLDFKCVRKSSRGKDRSTKNSTISNRALITSGSVDGSATRNANKRAPGPVMVRSITDNNDPLVSPDKVSVNSKFRRVAASISITLPA